MELIAANCSEPRRPELTFAAIARKYLARTAPDADDQSRPLFREKAVRAASTASSTSSAVAAGILPERSGDTITAMPDRDLPETGRVQTRIDYRNNRSGRKVDKGRTNRRSARWPG